MDLIRIRPVGTAISTRLPRCGPAHFEIAGSLRTGLHGLLPSLLLGLFPAGPSITLLDHSIWPCWAAEICSILGLFNWTSLSGLEMALFLSLLMDLIRIGPVGTAISTRLPRCGPAHFEIAGSLRTGLHGLLPSLLLGMFSAGPSITLLDHSTWPCWAAEICSILGLVNWTSLSGLEMALEGKLDELRTKSAYDDLRIITPEVLLYARGKIVSRDGFGRALCVKIIGASNGKSWVHIFEGTLSTLFWTVESEISFGIVSPGLGPLWFLPGRDGGDGTKCTRATTKKSDERVDTIMGGWGGYFGDNKAREWMWQLMLLPVLVVDYFFGWIKVLCLHGRCDMQLIRYNGNKGGGWFEGMRLEKGNEVPPRQLVIQRIRGRSKHVNKEKPFELKFFEPPDPGDSKPVEEEMKDVGAETPSLAGMLTTDKVTMNMEYAGDSILNNILIQSSCDDVLIEGEEQEVSSDQSTKHRSFTDMTSDKGVIPAYVGGEKENEGPTGPTTNKFNFGTGKGKEIHVADKGKLKIFNNPGLRKIKEKEARLLEIAKNINATSENNKLINSIMGLKRSRITRFFARMNEAGHVMIDENMIENGTEGGDPTPVPITLRQTSYANKVTGQEDTPGEDLHTNPTIAKPRNQEEKGRQGIFKPSGTMGNDSAKGMQRNGHPNVTVTETSNRFMLLDEEGNELEGDMGTVSKDTREDISLVESNARWARKQERNLNISYSQTLNQDQRIEAKRYVIQKQLPDPEILGVWPKQQLNYFKQLCHLYEYGEGFRWASYVREEELDSDDANAAIHSQYCEEVDSESNATATFLKDDNLNQYQAPSEGMTIVEGVDQVQMDMDIVQAGNIGLEINGA
ncbi:hypothetical protein L1987_32365 [Smallanthus sonchifolius]|uniref:Uncharacterized protein n=1 Tax=Smallanthus sonchifolius TaxID=185202 RepID=A0ACB9I9N2_9ASTR|nr:hypothetical protein L1987_32365 [Smallanthus sonchifolius]